MDKSEGFVTRVKSETRERESQQPTERESVWTVDCGGQQGGQGEGVGQGRGPEPGQRHGPGAGVRPRPGQQKLRI